MIQPRSVIPRMKVLFLKMFNGLQKNVRILYCTCLSRFARFMILTVGLERGVLGLYEGVTARTLR